MHPIKHLKTITHHRNLVRKHCFACGLYWQGLTHDLSKFSIVEFWSGAKYFAGTESPNSVQRRVLGYTPAWLHHKGRNKHHLEYWIDYSLGEDTPMAGMRMPEKYVVEMVCDRIAASKTYLKDKYTDRGPWDYYEFGKNHLLMHPETRAQLEKCLSVLRDEGEEACFKYMRTELLHKKK